MHFLWALLFKWFAFSPNLFHLIPSSAHIKLRTWLGFNSIIDFVCAVKMSWISPINASFSFWALDLVIGLLGICKASFELFICAGAWGWLNFSSWLLSSREKSKNTKFLSWFTLPQGLRPVLCKLAKISTKQITRSVYNPCSQQVTNCSQQ